MGKTMRYVAFFKPYGVLSQFSEGSSVGDTLKDFGIPSHLYAAGRLDKDSEGLLLLTNDGAFIHELLSPQRPHPRTYWVQVEGVPTPEALINLSRGVLIGDYKTKRAEVELLTFDPPVDPRQPPIRVRKFIPTSWLQITLYEGKNRQVRRMTAAVGFPTLRLLRVKIGKLSLVEFPGKLGLNPGEWKEVTKEEIL